jgi:hypothetical protein
MAFNLCAYGLINRTLGLHPRGLNELVSWHFTPVAANDSVEGRYGKRIGVRS